ncbi:N-6 DNA methylase [Nocardia sp. MH4]|uniref:N-6 DNA methylase n=1 Tax=Nocardia sp. MH4 TaxID=1768677 RepID=UPI001C4F3042|nr:N-6 DNA methylase [Nocardia sp. MH4]
MSGDIPFAEQMTTAELAAAIGVDVASIAHWRGRGTGFPDGHLEGRLRTYSVGELLPWLDARAVPLRNVWHGEAAGVTYGDRLRSHFANRNATVSPRSGPADPRQAVLDAKALATRGFPGAAPAAVLEAVLSLAFVWVVDGAAWHRIESARGAVGTIVREVDPVFRRHGITSDAAALFDHIRSARPDAVQRLIKIGGGLGVDGFETIHRGLAQSEGATPSTYQTPQAVAELMAECVRPGSGSGFSVADLYCRHGELVSAVTGSRASADVEVIGRDSSIIRRVRMNLIMRGHTATTSVTQAPPWSSGKMRQHDVVVVNPPFNQPLDETDATWDYGEPPPRRANFAWLQAALTATADRGRAAVLMPVSSTATSDADERNIRKALIDKGVVRAIIRLSGDLFPVSSVDAAVWILGRPAGGVDDPSIVMVDATSSKFKISERDRPVLAGAEQIATLTRAPSGLVAGETREVAVERAVGPARAVAVPVSVVATHDYVLTPHTYLDVDELAGEQRIHGIKEFGRAADAALDSVRHSAPPPISFLRTDTRESGYPADWTIHKLGDLCEIKAGPSRLTRARIVTGDDATVPVLRPSSLEARRINTDGLDRTTDEIAADFADYILEADDILVVRVGQVQDAAMTASPMSGWLYDSNLTRLRLPSDGPLDPRYLLEFLLSRRTSDRIRATASVHVAPTMSARSLAELDVPVPPLDQQAVIVAALRDRETRIAALRDAIEAEEKLRGLLAEGLVGGVLGIGPDVA